MIDVSVVMGVYNGADSLLATVDSVLRQEGVALEFIVIDDGSTDATGQILDEWAARDARLVVVHQTNTGLTRALARGCAQAQGRFIARQDCGDISLPGRLALQCRDLQQRPDAVMVACATRFLGPRNEPLFVTARPGTELEQGLTALDLHEVKGPPHHGATMFRRDAYQTAGGYRVEFPVAQDLDLWLRLREHGACIGEREVAYEARLEAGGISSRRRAEQFRYAALAIDCARRRRGGHPEPDLRVQPAGARARRPSIALEQARFYYFIGCCLRASDPAAARRYFLDAFRAHPLLVKGLLRSVVPSIGTSRS